LKPSPLGYSCVGEIEFGAQIKGFSFDDIVAFRSRGAIHIEILSVSIELYVRGADNVLPKK